MRGIGSARAVEVADAQSWGSRLVPAADVHRHGIPRVLDLVDADADCLVTLDCDGMDPSILPAVLAPAPGGLLYWQVLELLRGLAAKCRIVGFDLVEFMPSRDTTGLAALTAARLAQTSDPGSASLRRCQPEEAVESIALGLADGRGALPVGFWSERTPFSLAPASVGLE